MRTLRGKPCSTGWTIFRVIVYLLAGATSLVLSLLVAYVVGRSSQWGQASFLSRAWSWEPDGRLAIAEYDVTDGFAVGRMYWKLEILDPGVVDELADGLERGPDGAVSVTTYPPLAWWPSDAPERSFRRWSHCAEKFMPCRDLFYDPATREAYLAWEWG